MNKRALEERLRTETPRYSPGAAFTRRVMDSLPARMEAVRTPSTAAFRWRAVVLAVACAACITLVMTKLLPGTRTTTEPAVAARSQNALKVPQVSVAQVEALTARLEDPLEKELQNMINDTRHAIRFVALNFLPEN